MDPVELVAGALRLRPWRAGDAGDVFAAMQDPACRLWGRAGGVPRQ